MVCFEGRGCLILVEELKSRKEGGIVVDGKQVLSHQSATQLDLGIYGNGLPNQVQTHPGEASAGVGLAEKLED